MSFYFLDIKPLTFTKEFLYKYMKRDPPPLHSPLAWSKAGGLPGNAVPAPGSCSCPEHSGFVWCEEPSLARATTVSHRRCQGSWSRRCPWKWAWPKTLRVPPAQRAPKTKAEAMLSFSTDHTGRTSAPAMWWPQCPSADCWGTSHTSLESSDTKSLL